MSLGGDFDKNESRLDRYLIEGERARAAQAAKAAIGYKSLFRRLCERVRPPRQDPSAGSENFTNT